MSEKCARLLACGAVRGRFCALQRRLEAVARKAGPFDALLAAGDFFGEHNFGETDKDTQLWQSIVEGRTKLSCVVYILGRSSRAACFPSEGGELAENVVCLGQAGKLVTQDGLVVAYLSGASENNYNNNANNNGDDKKDDDQNIKVGSEDEGCVVDQRRVDKLLSAVQAESSRFEGVDILLTSAWPANVDNLAENNLGSKASPLVAFAARKVAPRYHFAGMGDVHYERPPYRNHRVLSGPARHVTRFVGLASVNNKAKAKWLYAFNIVPMRHMAKAELVKQPADATDSPYLMDNNTRYTNAPIDDSKSGSQFFYDLKSRPEEDQVEGGQDQRERQRGHKREGQHRRGHDGYNKQRRIIPQTECWFCLSSKNVAKHLVVSVGDHSYLALPKGGLSEDHVLILPIACYSSMLHVPPEVEEEIERYKQALHKCFAKQRQKLVLYERNYKSNHAQLQAVPVPASCEMGSVFNDIGSSMGIDFEPIPEHATLKHMAQPGTPYFYVELPDGQKLYHRVRSGFPIQFGREVLASEQVLNVTDRVDWRNCQCDQDTETKMTKAFRQKFEPFDFTLQ